YLRTPPSAILYVAVICASRRCPTATTHDRTHGSLQALATLYSATVVLVDGSHPAIGGVGGSLWSDGWHSGMQTLTFGASDNSGISETRVLADGGGLARNTRACDFTKPVPCAQGGDSIPVDTG